MKADSDPPVSFNKNFSEQKDDTFSYNNLLEIYEKKSFTHETESGYYAYVQPLVPGYIFLCRSKAVVSKQEIASSPEKKHLFWKQQRSTGYKIHISIDTEEKNLQNAWNILYLILMKHKIYHSKIIHKSFLKQSIPGKEVTIYAFQEQRPTEDWQRFMEDVTIEFKKNEIRPNILALEDQQIRGSIYFTYRNDSINYTLEDPFRDIDLTDKIKIEIYP